MGFCYGLNPSPTVNDSKVVAGSAKLGTYSIEIFGLTSGVKYFIRAYCDEGGVCVYGGEIEVTTVTNADIISDVEGNNYVIVSIGNQVWMRDNLKVTHYRNGEPILNLTDNSLWSNAKIGAFCYYGNNPNMNGIYGALYNFYTTIDGRYLCPTGWRVPSQEEWEVLIENLGGESIAGGKMKEAGTLHWNSPNKGATNESSFTGLPAGYRDNNGEFNEMGVYGKWWSTSNDSSYRYLSFNDASLSKENNYKVFGTSIRCLKGEGLVLPIVNTTQITTTSSTCANARGNVISNGGAEVYVKGICWDTNQNPTVDLATKTVDDSPGTGAFVNSVIGLTEGTTYYARAYATNSVGTVYGSTISWVQKQTIITLSPTAINGLDINTLSTPQSGVIFEIRKEVFNQSALNQTTTVVLKVDTDTSIIKAYNMANGTTLEPLPNVLGTISPTITGDEVTVVFDVSESVKYVSLTIPNALGFDFSKDYALAFRLFDVTGEGIINTSLNNTIVAKIRAKNKYDGIYNVTANSPMVDIVNTSLTGFYPFIYHLKALGEYTVLCLLYANNSIAGYYHPITSGESMSLYGSFGLQIEFDHSGNGNIIGVYNPWGNPPANTRMPAIDPSGVNNWDNSSKNIQFKYWMLQPSSVTTDPYIRVYFDETWTYIGPR